MGFGVVIDGLRKGSAHPTVCWIRADLGGPRAPFSMDETIPQLVETLLAQQGVPGLRFIDRHGVTVAW
ncbi:Rossmann-fold NAD(P)-binding domain-containing protein [Acidiphilium acidophilum]|uniref:hypothetical protein n=1 Tax=Acidiphilium acidophilum TaxID=76588 RepID=UPI0029CA2606|nr:hypothetical protein [Acidiphilium acidophilum]